MNPLATAAWMQLSRSTFFKGLPDADCRALADACRRRRFGKRDPLFAEGAAGTAMYLLTDGNVQLFKTNAEGREIVIRTLKPGDVFAEIILQGEGRYPVSAVALGPVEVLEIQRADIRRLLADRTFRDDFIGFLMAKLRYLADRVNYLTSSDVEERFFQFIREQYGEGPDIRIDLSKRDIAAAIGATPETLSRLIQRLTREKRVTWRGRHLRLLPIPTHARAGVRGR
jgi:CRP/FNR family transcriptional regulator